MEGCSGSLEWGGGMKGVNTRLLERLFAMFAGSGSLSFFFFKAFIEFVTILLLFYVLVFLAISHV